MKAAKAALLAAPALLAVTAAGNAEAVQKSANVQLYVPLVCGIGLVSLSQSGDQVVATFNEGCNSAGGYDVFAHWSAAYDGRREVRVDGALVDDTGNGMVHLVASNGPGVRQRQMTIDLNGDTGATQNISLSITPR